MALPFRRRIFVILVVMTVVPTVLAVAGWVVSIRRLLPAAGARASTERVAATARSLLEGVDTLHLTVRERALLRQHLDEVSASVSLARRAETFLRYYTAGVAVVILLLGAGVLYAAVNLAGHLSRQLSRPIDELVGWTSLIRRPEPLPAAGGPLSRGAPEFESLRQALRELAAALAAARERELEAERLRAFREVARRVAHEIKNPLTSMRIAVDQLRRTDGMTEGRKETALEVMAAETDRLERLAREFADFGRLPEGPPSEVDLVELLEELGRTSVPDGVTVRLTANGGPRTIVGHYEPLRRAAARHSRSPFHRRPDHESTRSPRRRRSEHPPHGRRAVAIGRLRDDRSARRQRGPEARDRRRSGRGAARLDDAARSRRARDARADPQARAAGPGRHDERQGQPLRRRARNEARGLPVPREAAHARRRTRRAAQRARAGPHARGEQTAARAARPRRSARRDDRRDGGAARVDRACCPNGIARADHGRIRHRQGAGRIGDPPTECAWQ